VPAKYGDKIFIFPEARKKKLARFCLCGQKGLK
jgi:hypothetical protein